MPRDHHRPMPRGDEFFDALLGGQDPSLVSEAADRAAIVFVRGAKESGDPAVAERLLHLADTEGIDAIAEVWAGSPADSLAGCLWRLYLLRSWVHADPAGVAEEFAAGQANAPVARVVAGVAEPPGPDELRIMIDEVLRGIAGGDFADVLLRAAAFARVVAVGRAHRAGGVPENQGPGGAGADDGRRLLVLSEQLEAAGHAELRGELG